VNTKNEGSSGASEELMSNFFSSTQKKAAFAALTSISGWIVYLGRTGVKNLIFPVFESYFYQIKILIRLQF